MHIPSRRPAHEVVADIDYHLQAGHEPRQQVRETILQCISHQHAGIPIYSRVIIQPCSQSAVWYDSLGQFNHNTLVLTVETNRWYFGWHWPQNFQWVLQSVTFSSDLYSSSKNVYPLAALRCDDAKRATRHHRPRPPSERKFPFLSCIR